jgi:transcriptional regulator
VTAKAMKDKRRKLTDAQYRAIIALYERGWKQSAIALKFGIGQQWVSAILRREA